MKWITCGQGKKLPFDRSDKDEENHQGSFKEHAQQKKRLGYAE